MFPSIQIDAEILSQYDLDSNADGFLDGLSKVNLFVGANNSGKSRMLRWIFRQERLSFLFSPSVEAQEKSKSLNRILQKGFGGYVVQNPTKDNFRRILNTDLTQKIAEGVPLVDIEGIKPIFLASKKWLTNQHKDPLQKKLSEASTEFLSEIEKLLVRFHERIFIPLPRSTGLRTYDGIPDGKITPLSDVFRDNFILNYFWEEIQESPHILGQIYTGLDSYQRLLESLVGSPSQRTLISDEYNSFISKHFFGGQKIEIVPRHDWKVLGVKIGDEQKEDRKIFDLGDGVQAIILLTLPLFFERDRPTLVFIEEPEINLHPAYQRWFLEIISDKEFFPNHQFFITTHSNHFLDLSLESKGISIFNFSEGENGKKRIRSSHIGDLNLLNELGIQNSSIFLSNCTIWVEGIMDRAYIQQYLAMAQAEIQKKEPSEIHEKLTSFSGKGAGFREDLHYSFVEYGGANITHWEFDDETNGDHDPLVKKIQASRLSNRIFLILDRDYEDGETNTKEARHKQLENALGERCSILPVVEIENLLPESVIKGIAKSYGEDIPGDADWDGYQGKKLGRFIDEMLGKDRKRKTYGTQSGTVTQKKEFCDRAIGQLKKLTFKDLTDEAQDLVVSILTFIERNNNS